MSRRRAVVGLVAPFVILPLVARLFVAPMGDALAHAAHHMTMTPAASGSSAPAFVVSHEEPEVVHFREHGAAASAARPSAPKPGGSAKPSPSSDAGASPRSATIVVPATAVARALEDKKASARDVVDAEGKPFGAKLRGVSQYRAGLQDGDIVIEIGGTRVRSTSEMAQKALEQGAGGATKLTGKILRGDVTIDVVLVLPEKS